MIGLDTNVLVRFLVEDDKAQSARAVKLIRRAIADDAPLFVSEVVLCEVVWVLRVSYKIPRADIVKALKQLLHARHLVWSARELLVASLDAYEQGRGDFADYVIRAQCQGAGCDAVTTFDGALLREDGFVAPPTV